LTNRAHQCYTLPILSRSATFIITLVSLFFLVTLPVQADGTTSEVVCTPVYGMADACIEHIAVDTAGETDLFYSLSGLSYVAGLISFIKAKLLNA
jgi:hypothetical protein